MVVLGDGRFLMSEVPQYLNMSEVPQYMNMSEVPLYMVVMVVSVRKKRHCTSPLKIPSINRLWDT